jgi:alpha-beta hydrolase superfamily lysophospholipase
MKTRVVGLLKWVASLVVVGVLAALAVRAYDAQRGPPLELWHTYVPREMTAAEIGKADWAQYLAAEQRVMDAVRHEVTDRLAPESRHAANRYFAESPLYPGRFAQDWNRSFVLAPDGTPVGAVVLLHGLTDSPYSMRALARHYRDRGFVAVSIRLPGHGTVPAGLTDIGWEQWMEATRLAAREARHRAGATAPLHLVGYSNGGALAVKYTLDALGDPSLPRPERVVLISPMIGVTAFARFAGVLGWPAVFPSFAKAAWLGIVPEFNPFKYNSFPVNGARQSSLVARTLQAQIAEYAREGRLAALPPILTFQSVVDFTVSTRAIVDALYVHLPANGSELVLFDLNRNARFGPLLRESDDLDVDHLLPNPPRRYRTTVLTNAGADRNEMVERVTPAGATTASDRALRLAYPAEVFSLSHIALPFPLNDPLYGMTPDPTESFGINLGAIAPRGERGALVVGAEALARMSSNPFFPHLLERIDEGLGQRAPPAVAK